MGSILIVDDDRQLCMMLRDYFCLQSLDLAMCHDGVAGLKAAMTDRFHLVILDVMLPGLDGFEILRRLRATSHVSILMLTARSDDEALVYGLENGADDYVPKPFNPRELLARVRAILRRRDSRQATATASARPVDVSQCGFSFNPTARMARYRGVPLTLSSVEYSLLEALLEYPGEVRPREQLAERVFNRTYHPLDRGLDMLVSRLRRKLEVADNPGAWIRTVRSAGYVFAIPDQALGD